MLWLPILVNKDNRVVVQGITGRQGSFHTKLMVEYGTKVVAGVTPSRGGTQTLGIPVYDTVYEAVEEQGADVSIIFVPAPFAKEAVLETLDAGLRKIIVITEHIPIKDSIEFITKARSKGADIIGPNTPGVITPGEIKVGIMPASVFKPGSVGLVSRSGTLTYEIAARISESGLGESTCVGVGGDPVTGSNFIDMLRLFMEDEGTSAAVLVGEIGGNAEEKAADFVKQARFKKPIVSYIAGRAAPPGKRMGHAGAIIMGNVGTAESKIQALTSVGALIAEKPGDIPDLLLRAIRR